MRLGVISDIHGSLPPLEAVLDEFKKLPVDEILVAGDMTCGPNSVEVLRRLQQENCHMVLGNNEGYLLRFDSGLAPGWWFSSHQWAFTRWTYQHLDRPSLELLHTLPEQSILDLPGCLPIRMFHGSLQATDEHLDPTLRPEPLEYAFARTIEAVLICGHTHRPWKILRNGRLAFNPGAICFPSDGVLDAQYAILTWDAGQWSVEHYSIPYDRARVHADYQESGLLEAGGVFARAVLLSIETGHDLAMEFLHYAFKIAEESGHPGCEYVADEVWDRAA